MDEDEFICIRQIKKTVLLALPGCYAYNELVGIKKILEKWKRKYVPHLKGVMVDYKNVTFSKSSGVLASNAPKSCYHVTATFDLFCPKVGDITKGKINRTSKDHIGCLIQNTINVSIRLPRHLDFSKFIYLNHEVLFEITHFHFTQHVIDVKGKITPKCIELMNNLLPPIDQNFNKLDDSTLDERMDAESVSSNDDTTTEINLTNNIPNAKVKYENDLFPLFLSSKVSNLESDIKNNESDTSTVVASPKKKKKHKEKNVESNLSDLSTPKVPFLDPNIIDTLLQPIKQEVSPVKSSASLLPTKPNKKKRKRESSVSDHDASDQPKKKKRHKSKDTESKNTDKKSKSKNTDKKSESKNTDKKSKSKNTDKKSKSKKEKSKSLKKKAKLAASGTVLKKDKKKLQKSKREKKLSSHKSKKNKDPKKDKTAKKPSKKLKDGNLNIKHEIKSEFQ